MTSNDLMAAAQQDRRRRERRYYLAMALLFIAAVPAIALLPFWSPQSGLVGLGLITAFTVGSLYADGGDALQRDRAIAAFALGGLACLIVVAAQVALMSADADRNASPLLALRVFCGAWLVSDLVFRQWPGLRKSES